MTVVVFWALAAVILYAYAGYMLVILVLSRFIHNPVRRASIEPMVTYLITAYNEEMNIGTKLEQVFTLDYPRDKFEILVASDGSTDRTDEIVQSFSDRGVRLIRVEGRVGKTETQNRAVQQAKGDIIIFSDATTFYEKSAIRHIVRNYADPSVGAVSGRYQYFNPTGASIGVGGILFWDYENTLKRLQTHIRTITGACGCIYSVRRALYEPLPADVISDLVEPLRILEKGYRIVFEPEAIAYEETTEHAAEEFGMRVRVAVRGMRGLWYMRKLFNPLSHGFVAFQLFSHKVLRWLVPFFLLGLLVTNVFLLGIPFYNAAFIAQVLFYSLAFGGFLLERARIRFRPLALPLYFVTVNAAAAVAIYRIWKGYKAVTWETVRR